MECSSKDFDWFRDMITDIIADHNLSDWESGFISSIEDRIKNQIPLSDKQIKCLTKIWQR